MSDLGSGAFGTVIKVKNNLGIFALKMIEKTKTNEKVIKEVEMLSKCSEEYVVKCFDSWIESNKLYIQMELCSDNLKNIIQQKRECFERQLTDVMTTTEFFICSQLMKEILECVQYLHQLDPPIIHRDLKPQNILVNYEPKNNRFLKLCDFGLSRDLSKESVSYTADMGTTGYMAPEVAPKIGYQRRKYTEKADIYSLHRIALDIFDFDIYE